MPATLDLSPELEADPTPSSASTSSNAILPTSPPGERSTSRAEARTVNWREEQAIMQHQLRQAKAEIAHLRSKLGMQSNAAAFNASSPRQSLGSPAPESGPTPRRRSVSPFDTSGSSPRSADGAVLASSPRSVSSNRSFGPGGAGMPGSVAMNRALISNEGGETVETLLAEPSEGLRVRSSETEPVSPLSLAVPDPINAVLAESISAATTSTAPAPGLTANGLPQPAPRSRSPLPSGSPSSNPFFGSSGVTRERLSKSAASAQSGSGKVISGLQSDLLQARSALESTRGQLRLSQRAVEHLGRQTEDLRETKERLSSEIQGLNRQLARKERLQDEALARARAAEASLATAQKELTDLKATVKSRMKELEEGAKRAEEAKVKTEREYTALRDGLRTMQDGWRDDLRWLKDDLKRTQRELDTKTSTITKLLAEREGIASLHVSDLSSLRAHHVAFQEQHTSESSTALKQLGLLSGRTEQDRQRTESLREEFARLRRAMVDFEMEAAAGPPASGMAVSSLVEGATG
ncbi:hypothetical protein C6P46_006654 [Rhodotorula mucilaginosa]|uniref:SWI5-dependent HO expression protein 3 n=1 Tax=Rhodotorula mucilaginosa TaxID=5537 RepID=A0A9P6VWL5_RHOMI|nr:hypothetical protein C6P46_006654 [Rhodotorula mucilaginosa]